MIGWLAKKVFEVQADSLTNKFCNDPRMTKLFEKYHEDTKEFKQELKDLGMTSLDDLRTAIKTRPGLKNFKL
jgi:hypothetical protein